jgi:hypothetical protein
MAFLGELLAAFHCDNESAEERKEPRRTVDIRRTISFGAPVSVPSDPDFPTWSALLQEGAVIEHQAVALVVFVKRAL